MDLPALHLLLPEQWPLLEYLGWMLQHGVSLAARDPEFSHPSPAGEPTGDFARAHHRAWRPACRDGWARTKDEVGRSHHPGAHPTEGLEESPNYNPTAVDKIILDSGK